MLVLRAQPASPGNPVREVTRLERVPEPPGGLVPYRQGSLTGYADTTGRLVIQPFPHVPTAWFFLDGLLPLDVGALAVKVKERIRYVFLNARGELLVVRWSEAAVLQPDGSLLRRPRHEVLGQLEVVSPAYTQSNHAYEHLLTVPVRPESVLPPPAAHAQYHVKSLGAGRATHSSTREDIRPFLLESGLRRYEQYAHYALTDSAGRHLTRHRFDNLYPFRQGLAKARVRLRRSEPREYGQNLARRARYGFIDRRGRWRIRPRFDGVTEFSGGVAVVRRGERYGIIDPWGHWLLRLQPNKLAGPDEDGYVRMWLPGPGKESVYGGARYVAPPGRPALAARFNEAGPFVNGRAWVQRAGRPGLIDRTGRWLTDSGYSELAPPHWLRNDDRNLDVSEGWAQMHAPNFAGLLHEYEGSRAGAWELRAKTTEPYAPLQGALVPDTAYLVGQRNGYCVLVARASGRETTLAHYDKVLLNPCRGLACLLRDDHPYVVEVATGRELFEGRYAGLDLLTPRGRLRYVTRSEPAAWALLDTLGHLRTPWVPGQGFPTPEGWLLSQEGPQRWTLRDSTGAVALATTGRIEHTLWTTLWEDTQRDIHDYGYFGYYWLLSTRYRNPYARAAFVVHENGGLRYLDAHLREIGRTQAIQLLLQYSGWGYDSKNRRLVTDEGRPLFDLPPGAEWSANGIYLDRLWYGHGVLLTTKGFITRGRRPLWTD